MDCLVLCRVQGMSVGCTRSDCAFPVTWRKLDGGYFLITWYLLILLPLACWLIRVALTLTPRMGKLLPPPPLTLLIPLLDLVRARTCHFRMEDARSAIVFSAFSRRRFCEEEDCLEVRKRCTARSDVDGSDGVADC